LLRSSVSVAGLAQRVAWLPLGRDERDPQRFWLLVLGAGCVNCVPSDYSGADPGWAQSCGVEAAGLAGGCPGFPLV